MTDWLILIIESLTAAGFAVVVPTIVAAAIDHATMGSVPGKVWAKILGVVWVIGAFWLYSPQQMPLAAGLVTVAAAAATIFLSRKDAKNRRVT